MLHFKTNGNEGTLEDSPFYREQSELRDCIGWPLEFTPEQLLVIGRR
ncbi:MAG: hypothetical protein GX046_04730 [Tissierellia bacterium]|nr:hypothetical protein [Tissierellia bacterium]